MAIAHEAWPSALNAQLGESQVGFISMGVYFLSKIKRFFFSVGFFSGTEVQHGASTNIGNYSGKGEKPTCQILGLSTIVTPAVI